jgi:tetratricopeptide (TPR) repeat protein
LDSKRRASILKSLRNASLLWIAAALLALGTASQSRAESPAPPADLATRAREAYDAAKFQEAISLWLQAGRYEELSADTLFNIGNACYRAGSPGHAALYYRRALSRNPSHQESRQNLRFLERKYGSITVQRPEYQYALARFPLSTWKNTLWTGIWLCLLAGLVFPATRSGARIRLPAIAALAIGPLIAIAGGLGWRHFPNDSEFAPIARQAVVIAEKAVLHADAARTSPEVIDAPPGSLCEVIQRSGRWAYIAFATKTRGWIPLDAIEPVTPATPPTPPKIRKPRADGKSA